MMIELKLTDEHNAYMQLDPKERKAIYKEFDNQEKRFFVADFECTTEIPYKVYLVTMKEIDTDNSWVFYSIDEWFEYMHQFKHSVVWFHNGSAYDFEFIIYYCKQHSIKLGMNRSLKVKQDTQFVKTHKGTGQLSLKNGLPQPIYSVIELLDSRDIVSSSIAKLGTAFGMEKGMGEVVTPLVRYIHSDTDWEYMTGDIFEGNDEYFKMTTSFKQALEDMRWTEYAVRDTDILELVARKMKFIDHYEERKFTIASIAHNEMLRSNPEYAQHRQCLKSLYKADENAKKNDNLIRDLAKRAYKGGVAWSNPRLRGRLIKTEHGYHFDYTSMYPSIYGQPDLYPLPDVTKYYKGIPPKNRNKDELLALIPYKRLHATVKPGCFPLIKERTDTGGPNSAYYLNEVQITEDSKPLVLTSIENAYLLACYDIHDCQLGYPVYFERNKPLEKAMKAHKDKWFEVKDNATSEAIRLYAKLMLNTVYGYLGFYNKEVARYDYIFDEDNEEVEKQRRDKLDMTGLDTAEVAAAAFITAYGRVKLAMDINAIGIDRVVCCDTDSLFVVDVPYEELEQKIAISDKLGDFKKEHTFTQIRSIKAKTYAIANKDGWIEAQATAGSNFKFEHIDDFHAGKEFPSRMLKRGPGGIGIVPIHKTLGGKPKNDKRGTDTTEDNAKKIS